MNSRIIEHLKIIKKRPFIYVKDVEELKAFLFGLEVGAFGFMIGMSESLLFIRDVKPKSDKDIDWAQSLIDLYIEEFKRM